MEKQYDIIDTVCVFVPSKLQTAKWIQQGWRYVQWLLKFMV